jgi:hypothetical protein
MSEIRKLYCAVEFAIVPMIEALKPVTIEVESRSQAPSLRLKRWHVALCTHYIDDLLSHAPLPLCNYWGYGQVPSYTLSRKNNLRLGDLGALGDTFFYMGTQNGSKLEI